MTHKNIFISPDFTPQERAKNKQLHVELQRRKASGETALIIKRGRIISKQPPKGPPQSMDSTPTHLLSTAAPQSMDSTSTSH